MPGLEQKWIAIIFFKQKFTLKLFIIYKMAYSCYFSLLGNLKNASVASQKLHNIDH